MNIVYSDHAIIRTKQRGITNLEVEFVLEHPITMTQSPEERILITGFAKNRLIKVVLTKLERYIKIITVI